MAIVVGDTSGLAQGISTAGGALAQALEKRAEQRLLGQQKQQKQQEFNTLLDSLIGQGGELGGVAQKMKDSGVGHEMGLGFLQEGFKDQNKPGPKDPFAGLSHEELTKTLVDLELPRSKADSLAKLYMSSSVGGKTQLTKYVFDQLRRGGFKSDSEDKTN